MAEEPKAIAFGKKITFLAGDFHQVSQIA